MNKVTESTAKKRNPPKMPASQPEATEQKAAVRHLDTLYYLVREILTAARNRAWQAVNTVMVGLLVATG